MMTFLQNSCQKMSKQPVQTSKQLQEAENRFSLKNKAPHCCYKSASAYMSWLDNIPTVFAAAPLPLFSLRGVLVGLQLKHRPLYTGSVHISITITSPFRSAVGLISLCPIQEVKTWSYSNNWKNVGWNEGNSSKYCENKRGKCGLFR